MEKKMTIANKDRISFQNGTRSGMVVHVCNLSTWKTEADRAA